MIAVSIPGFAELALTDLVCDYNGTLARDGRLLPGVGEALRELAASLRIHVITADTFGGVAAELAGLPVALTVIGPGGQAAAKRAFVERLGAAGVAAMGNGRNDGGMLAAAALGIAVLGGEGAAMATLAQARVVALGALDALDLLRRPQRLIATLRD
jgi:soluble P-type ATPase